MEPGGELAQEVDVELVAFGHEELVPADEKSIPRDDEGEGDPRKAVVDCDEDDHGRVDHEAVGERVGDPAEGGLDVPAAGEPAVDLVGDPSDCEDGRGRPAVAPVGRDQQRGEDRDQEQPQDRERVRNARQRSGDRTCGHGSRIVPCGSIAAQP